MFMFGESKTGVARLHGWCLRFLPDFGALSEKFIGGKSCGRRASRRSYVKAQAAATATALAPARNKCSGARSLAARTSSAVAV